MAIILTLTGTARLFAQEYRADDPRWTDEDTTNDPNTCFEAGAACENDDEWVYGWHRARILAVLAGQQRADRDGSTASAGAPNVDQLVSVSSRAYDDFPPCPIMHVCVGYRPSGLYYIFAPGGPCCYPSQALYRLETAGNN